MIVYVIAIILALILFYSCHVFILDRRFKMPPGPLPLPFIGNLYLFSSKVRGWASLKDLAGGYGDIFTFYLGQYRLIVLSSPQVIHEGLVKQSKVLNDRASFLPDLVNVKSGVILASGALWQENRRFAFRAMREFGMGKMAILDRLHDETGNLLAEMEAKENRPFVPHKLIANAVSNIICSIVFGKRFDYGDARFRAILSILDLILSRPFSQEAKLYFFPPLHLIHPHPQVKDLADLAKMIEKQLEESVANHRKDFDKNNIRDFPDLFIQSEFDGEKFDMEAFALLMRDLFGAGTETTATALTWTLLYLCKYPEIQKRCHEEIDSVIGTSRLPVLDDRPKLAYIDAVMYEILRIVTIVPLAIFHANIDGEVAIKGYDVPKTSSVVYNIWAVHHDENYWKNPEVFDPERWLDSDGKLIQHSSHFMPFGIGPRICLGELLARVEYFVFIVSILQRYSFTLVDKDVSLDDGVGGITYAPPQFSLIASKR